MRRLFFQSKDAMDATLGQCRIRPKCMETAKESVAFRRHSGKWAIGDNWSASCGTIPG